MNRQDDDSPRDVVEEAVRQLAGTAIDEDRMAAGVEKARAVLADAIATGRIRGERRYSIRGSSMNRRWWRWAVAAGIVIVGGAGAWLWSAGGGSGVAFGQVMQQIRAVGAVTFKVTAPVGGPSEGAGGAVFEVMESPSGRTRFTYPGGTVMVHDPGGRRSLILDPTKKHAVLTTITGNDGLSENSFSILRDIREETGEFRGSEIVDGRAAAVFEAEAEGRRCVVWADSRTGLPVRVEVHQRNVTEADRPIVLHDFRYNVELDDSLFSLEPPEGYTLEEKRAEPAKLAETTEQDLVGILAVWADLGGGAYPATFDQMGFSNFLLKMRGELGDEPARERIRAAFDAHFPGTGGDQKARMRQMTAGFRFAAQCAQWRYVGAGVKAVDENTPVCWWKSPTAETFRVVYGDLTVRDVTADELPAVP